MKKIILLLILISLTGCSDYKELSDMAMVSSFAVDKNKDEYKVVIQVLDAVAKADESNATPSVILYENTGKTLHEAFRNTVLESPKKMYLGYLDTVIVSEELLKENASIFIDFILRDPEVEKDFNLIMTKDDINEIMNIIPPIISIPSENISLSIDLSSKIQGMVSNITFDEFVSNLLIEGIEATLPIIYIEEYNSENEEINPSKRLKLDEETAIFKNNKLHNYISSDASLGLNIINNKISTPVISFKCDDNNYASSEIIKNKSSFTYDIDKNKLNIKVNITATLSELNCNIDISNKKGVDKIQELLKNKIKGVIEKTIEEEKKYNSDYIGIGKYIYQNNYKYYKDNKNNIDNIIKNMNTNIDINITYSQKSAIKKGDEK